MKIIALIGGNEFRPDCIPMDTYLLGLVSRQPARVLIVPTAAAHERPDLAARNGVRHFAALGATASGLMAITRADWESSEFVRSVDDADIIYLTGGDPGYLLQTIRETALLEAILQRCDDGAILAGSSAGAMVLGEYMRQRAGGWTSALGIVPGIAVLPHYRPAGKPGGLVRPTDLPVGVVLIGIGEATGCVSQENGSWAVVGASGVAVAGLDDEREYHVGQSFALP